MACITSVKHLTGSFDDTLQVPFVVDPKSVAFQKMGIWNGAIVSAMTATDCTVHLPETFHTDISTRKTNSTQIDAFTVPTGIRLVVKWEQIVTHIIKGTKNTPEKKTTQMIMVIDRSASSKDIGIPAKYSWVHAVNNLVGFYTPDTDNTSLIFDKGAFDTASVQTLST